MIDAPGVLYNGECCVEAPWHYAQRILWLPIVPLLMLIGLATWIAGIIAGRDKEKRTDSGIS